MTDRSQPPRGLRTRRKAQKIDRAKVVDLHKKGLNTVEIAQHQGVAPSTIWRFLQQTEPERKALEQFKSGRADILARIHAKSVDLKEKVLDSFDDGVIGALKPGQKSGLLVALNLVAGTTFDKERLERGQSTANVSMLSKMIDASVTTLYTRKAGASSKPVPASKQPVPTEPDHD